MNLYVLVEGEETEMQVYSRWIEHLLGFKKIKTPQDAGQQDYYLVCGFGYPNILEHELPNAISTVNDNSHKFNYLVLCLDSEEDSIQDRIDEVLEVIREKKLELEKHCSLEIIVQHRCMETWFLGNKSVYPRQPNTPDFIEFSRYYNVYENDPEEMGKHTFRQHAHFHKRYLTAMLLEKNLHYQKNNPKTVCESSYIAELQKRVAEPEAHLQSLKKFFDFCATIKQTNKHFPLLFKIKSCPNSSTSTTTPTIPCSTAQPHPKRSSKPLPHRDTQPSHSPTTA